jgi:hypothetical protein
MTKYEYYYNITPEAGKVRNNLVYTSLISEDKKTFVQWFHNDTEYHMGMNEVVDPELMEAKWLREVNFLTQMRNKYPELVPEILEINFHDHKIYLKIDGVDFWQQSLDKAITFDQVLPDWQDQMLNIISAHKSLNLYKYSLHPNSYFIVDGQLKSINYFFTYRGDEPLITIEEHRSHISKNRQQEMESKMKFLGLDWSSKLPFDKLQRLCFESFRANYPDNFIEKAIEVYAN